MLRSRVGEVVALDHVLWWCDEEESSIFAAKPGARVEAVQRLEYIYAFYGYLAIVPMHIEQASPFARAGMLRVTMRDPVVVK